MIGVPQLSVVVVSWNAADDLERCLTSLLTHTRVESMEVVVVDNGSTDGSVEIARAFRGVRVVQNADNRGAGGARNQGMAEARGELVLLLDCDTYVVDDVVGRAVRELYARPDVSILGCELRFPGGARQYNAHRAMSIRLTLLRDLWLYKLLPPYERPRALLGGYYDSDEEVDADWLAAPFILLRRRVFTEFGGFNERIFPEDSEWGIRMTQHGQRTVYMPHLGFAYHTGGTSTRVSTVAKLRLHHVAGLKAYRLLNGTLPAVGYWLAQLTGTCVRWSVYAAARRLRPEDAFYASQARDYRELAQVYLRMPVGR